MKTALIALDFINDITHPNGKIASSANEVIKNNVIQHANTSLEMAKQKDWIRILVKVGFHHNYLDQPKNSKMFGKLDEFGALLEGTSGLDFHPDLNISLGQLIITKPRISAFYGTNLDATLRANNIKRVVLCGVSSTWAVQATARDAHDRDYQVVVLESACAAETEEEHLVSMNILKNIADVISIDNLNDLS